MLPTADPGPRVLEGGPVNADRAPRVDTQEDGADPTLAPLLDGAPD